MTLVYALRCGTERLCYDDCCNCGILATSSLNHGTLQLSVKVYLYLVLFNTLSWHSNNELNTHMRTHNLHMHTKC